MSCKCGGNCDCGSDCKCGRNPSLGFSETVAAAATVKATISGVAPVKMHVEEMMPEMSTEGGHACKCGSSCTCDPCNC